MNTKKSRYGRPSEPDGGLPRLLPAGMAFFLFVGVLAWQTLTTIEEEMRITVAEELRAVLDVTRKSLLSWIDHRTDDVRMMAEYRDAPERIRDMLAPPRNRETLLARPALLEMREKIGRILRFHGDLDFSVVSPDGVTVASMWDGDIGEKRFLEKHGNYLKRISRGENVLVLPMGPDAPSMDGSGKPGGHAPTMILGVPVREKGAVVAAFLVWIDPTREFTEITHEAGTGATGDTYAFNRKGEVLTSLRFSEQLRALGLLASGESEIASFIPRDPGCDPASGSHPVPPRENWPYTHMIKQALTGRAGIQVVGYRGYRGARVVGAWAWNSDYDFGLAFEIDKAEAYQPYYVIRRVVILFMGILIAVFTLSSAYFLRSRHNAVKLANSIRDKSDELKEWRNRYEVAVSTSGHILFDWDSTTNEVTYGGDLEKILGYTMEEMTGGLDRWQALIHPDDLEGFKTTIARIIETREPASLTYRVRRKDGRYTHMEDEGEFFTDARGNVVRMIGFVKDVSERKKAEEEKANLESQLRQAHKMEAIGTLAGGIAHDFNNILSAILGYSEMASDDIPESAPAKRDIREVLKAGNRAKDLVKHILAFSRKSEQERIPLEIYLIVKETLKLLRASIPTTIEIRQDIDPGCGAVLADPTQVHQVMMNLCTNAAQAMEEKGGILDVALGLVALSEKDVQNESTLKPGRYVKLTVRDTGPGVDRSHMDRIFDPYFTTKEVGKGSGMGLAVVHGIVKSHDGMITVDSQSGAGAAFNVFIPRIEKMRRKKTEKRVPPPTGSERILVVDDEESVCEITKRRLEQLGYHVTYETDGMAALELFRSRPRAFDLIITDQAMPTMTGEHLARELMRIQPDIPIILCTGYSSRIDAEKAGFLGIGAFIMKPVDKEDLAMTIRRVLDSK